MLAFHPLTLHGSLGNRHRSQRRRALALRWTGEDVVYAPSPTRMPIHYRHDSEVGGKLRGAALSADPAGARPSRTGTPSPAREACRTQAAFVGPSQSVRSHALADARHPAFAIQADLELLTWMSGGVTRFGPYELISNCDRPP